MRGWKPSKSQKRDFAIQMQEIEAFCREHNISRSLSSDSYYFTVNGKNYRVSNHTIEASDRGMYNFTAEKVRDSYHDNDNIDVYITASKTRIIEIYNDIVSGYKLNKRGQRI